MEEDSQCKPPEIREKSLETTFEILPQKSVEKYNRQYEIFMEWCKKHGINKYSENGQKIRKILQIENIDKRVKSTVFLSSADDKEFLTIKVGLILGIAGACQTDELVNLTVDDIEDVGSSLIVKIPNTKTKIPRIFVVTDVGKYA
ncbi:hypothetical protein NQ317_008716 [Molorchus minor]|uniref:Uncharacterized protein n=1 Tax=Molorchus minor TaxID=1323400 RepID=A0ABQ9IW47_9CUCU|nr:hypothetical protein NQ317_008716 [Molorchus minor]